MVELRGHIERLALVEGDLDETQRGDWLASNTEYDELDAQLTERTARAARLNAVRSADITVEPGDAPAVAGAREVQVKKIVETDEIFDRAGLRTDNPADGRTYRDRAMRAIEGWQKSIPAEYRESAERLIDNAPGSERDRAVADHILRTGSPEYVSAFNKYLANPNAVNTLPEAERAALNEGTTTQGGFMVPPFLDPSIILTNAGVSNPFRQLATVKTIATQTWKGVTSAGVTAEWTAESAEMTDASPALTQPTITPVRADAYLQASFEMIEDTAIGSELAMLFADARDRLEGAAFATGTGSTQPYGIVTELQLVTASRVASNTNGALGAVDVFALDNNLPQRWRAKASWVANKSIWNSVRQLATGTGGNQFAFWADFGGGRPANLIGYPVYESSAMQSTISTATASNDDLVVLGDFSQFYIVDRIGMSVAYNPLVLGANRRPTGEVGWAAFWRVGSRTVNADAFRLLRL